MRWLILISFILLIQPALAVYEAARYYTINDTYSVDMDLWKDGYVFASLEITLNHEAETLIELITLQGHTITFRVINSPFTVVDRYYIHITVDGEDRGWNNITRLGSPFEDKIYISFTGNSDDPNSTVDLLYMQMYYVTNVNFLESDPITRVEIASNEQMDVKIGVYTLEEYRETAELSNPTSIWDFFDQAKNFLAAAIEVTSSTFSLIMTVFHYFKLILIDNGIIVFGVWESLVLLNASFRSRDAITFFRRVVKAHQSLIDFTIQVVRRIIQIFTSIVQAIGSLIPFT